MKIKNMLLSNKKKVLFAVLTLCLICIVAASIYILQKNADSKKKVYKETSVMHGDLTVGITEEGAISIGSVEQSFDLDLSAYSSSDDDSTSDNGGMGMMPGGMGGMNLNFGSANQSGQEKIEVAEVNVSVGQEIHKGDVLYTLNSEDVDSIREMLENDVEDTKEDYDEVLLEQQQTKLQAQIEYETYVSNGDYANVEYLSSIAELQNTLEDKKESLQEISDTIDDNLQEILDYQYRLKKAKESLEEAIAGVEDHYEDRLDDAYYYLVFENAREDAQALVDEYEDKLESLENENEQLVYDMQTKAREVAASERELQTGTYDAEQQKAIEEYEKQVSTEWYDIQMTSVNAKVSDAEYAYQSAQSKLQEFNDTISGNELLAEYDGVVTSVELEGGDYVSQGTVLITLYNQDEITMDVTLSEEDKETAENCETISVSLTAYEDQTFDAAIETIGNAEYDSSSGTVYYTITVTIQNAEAGLYEGMTGEVTFITEESKEVTYVLKRAVIEEENRTYVKIKDENGNVVERDVEVGFSDGTNIEVISGLSEGETVLVESKVKES